MANPLDQLGVFTQRDHEELLEKARALVAQVEEYRRTIEEVVKLFEQLHSRLERARKDRAAA